MKTLALIVLCGLLCAAPASAGRLGSSYGWPVKPFHQAHAVRGSFGDPRTLFYGPPVKSTLLTGNGLFSFHFGVDISAPDGTSVYPVESGSVTGVTSQWVAVSNGARTFQYWHIKAAVAVGQHVDLETTVLGRIMRPCGHVHLAEIVQGVVVNPLQPGHLTPYTDTTAPTVASAAFRAGSTGGEALPELLHGRVEIVASAYDTPTVPVVGEWRALPVTPAVVRWRIQRPTGRTVVSTRTAYDVRSTIPPKSAFWLVYARGTHQNMPVFGKHYAYMQPGDYLFRLTPRGFDTRSLRNGVYELVVTAVDIAGNHGSLVQRIGVEN